MRDKDAPPPLSTLTEEEGALALARYRLLQPALEQGVPLARVATHHGLVLRTVQRWVTRYQVHGLAGLTRRTRADRGQSRHLRPELKHAIEGLALRTPAPSTAFVHKPGQQIVYISAELSRLCLIGVSPSISILALSHVEGPFCLYAAWLLIETSYTEYSRFNSAPV